MNFPLPHIEYEGRKCKYNLESSPNFVSKTSDEAVSDLNEFARDAGLYMDFMGPDYNLIDILLLIAMTLDNTNKQ